ncbi:MULTISPECIES: TadE/TadG family type IV pilus assembly protein [Bacillus]|uniref:TadE/TadG family type IV pilus assembly protein n=1 Tax=Bacillus TaxID=1386 RepID=UPI000BB84F81|nr:MULTISPECIES: TadE family protein [Bacillus]
MIKNEKGQATVELAISLTVLLILLFGIVDFGRIFHAYLTMEHAGREAARMASVGGTNEQIQIRFKDSAPSLQSNNISITISPTQAQQRTRGTYVTVEATYPVSFLFPAFKATLGDPLYVRSKTVMRVE